MATTGPAVALDRNEDAPDDDVGKSYKLLEVSELRFIREPDPDTKVDAVVYYRLICNPGEEYREVLSGNAYVLNNNGRTIEKFASCGLTKPNSEPTSDDPISRARPLFEAMVTELQGVNHRGKNEGVEALMLFFLEHNASR